MEAEHMTSRIKRIVSRKSASSVNTPDATLEQIDPNVLLPQVRAGIDTLRETQVTLSQREGELLNETLQLYEQLKGSAHALADVRKQQAVTSEQVDKLLAALQILESQQAGERSSSHGDPAIGETLVAQAEA